MIQRDFFLSVFGLIFSITIFAQCDNSVSTNHMAPYNNYLPSNPNGNDYLNSFNWVPRNEYLELELYNTFGLNPGLMLTGGKVNNIYSDQVNSYYDYLHTEQEPLHTNGWELVSVNLGYYPSGAEIADNPSSDFPYLILYNRFKGVVRVFGILGPGYGAFGTSINAVRVNLGFVNSNVNGLLRLNADKDVALDQITETTHITSLCEHPNQAGKWFSTDFQIAYDPCVCQYPSKLVVRCEFIESQTISLHGRSIGVDESLISGNSILNNNFLHGFDYSGNSADGGGVLMYKQLEFLLDDYISRLEAYRNELAAANQHNAEVERNLAFYKMGKKVVNDAVNAAITAFTGTPFFADLEQQFNSVNLVLLLKEKGVVSNDTIRLGPMIDALVKLGGKEIDKLIMSKMVHMAVPIKPLRPSATFTEMHFEGEIIKTTAINMVNNLFTPGSYGSSGTGSPILNSPFTYPVYNAPLGHFALLKTPVIQVYREEMNLNRDVIFTECGIFNHGFLFEEWEEVIQFKLAEPLLFTFNHSSGIQSDEMEAQIVATVTKNNSPGYASINMPLRKVSPNLAQRK
jgi:hypothetical protein